ncbi:PPC domain-containing DNA-binding protein [Methanoregula sp.]|uniref:PPC domain-containing DNA-binding protein n=1 Tax=Methanoregula sp. TaxID=2052170 RepID=UPI003C75C4FF
MQYTEGQLGRVFVVRIDDGEDMLVSLRQFVQDKGVRAGSIVFLGALMEGRMVTGPEEPVIPPVPHFVMFEGGWEVFGVGTIYPGEGGPHIHYHASVGRAGHALTGCLREKAVTYLIVEAVIYEFTGLSARKEYDEKTQLHLPVLSHENTSGTAEQEPVNEEPRPGPREEKKDEKSELPGGLAEIIRDLTRRPPT